MNIKIYKNKKLDRKAYILRAAKLKAAEKLEVVDYFFVNHKLPN